MADVSHSRSDLSGHPDVPEMRARYARMLGGRDVARLDGPMFLVGLFCALSPWIMHFTGNQPALATHNLIMGAAIVVMAVGFTLNPGRMSLLTRALCAMGVWLIIAPWIVGTNPDAGIIWTNAVAGGITCLLGLLCAAVTMRSRRKV